MPYHVPPVLPAVLLALSILLLPALARAQQVFSASGSDDLMTLLKAAKGGEEITLADGDYGTLELRGAYENRNIPRFERTVTIKAANPGQSRFASIRLRNIINLTFDGLALQEGFGVFNSRGVAITHTTGSHLYLRDVSGVRIEENRFSGGAVTLGMLSVSNFVIARNIFEKAHIDIMQIGRDTYDGLIEDNFLLDPQADEKGRHPDLMQFFGWQGMNPHDIVIRGNYLYDDISTGMVGAQGIFMADPRGLGYRNMLVEQNLIAAPHPNTIYISGGQENVLIRNNSLIAAFSGKYRGGTIRLARNKVLGNSGVRVEGNVAAGIIDQTKDASIGQNFLYKEASTIFAGTGAHWQDFRLLNPPLYRSALGALQRLEELQGTEQVDWARSMDQMIR